MPRRARSALAIAILAVAAVVPVYLAASLAGAVVSAAPDTGRAPGNGERIRLVTSPLHADFALPLDDALRKRFAFLREAGLPLDHPRATHLVFGWGAREFYMNTPTLADIRPRAAFLAVTGDDSVMHVSLAGDVGQDGEGLVLGLPPGGLARLMDFIEGSFRRPSGAPVLVPGRGYGPFDRFYEGEGRFNILRPCNVWVSEGLRAAGLKTGAWTPTTHALKLGLAWHAPEAMER